MESKLPSHRHSDDEIHEIRRHEVFMVPPSVINPKMVPAHPALLIPAYLTAIGGALPAAIELCSQVFLRPAVDMPLSSIAPTVLFTVPIAIPASCIAAALLFAAFIALRKPFSFHHATFIAVICLFNLVFGALHYFPQLRHAT